MLECENYVPDREIGFEKAFDSIQGCILSPFLFIMAVDWLMKTTTKGKRRGIRWTLTSCLEDLDFADDICLLSSSHKEAFSCHRCLAPHRDMNAKVREDNSGKERTMSKEGLGVMNNNGQRMYKWYSENNLIIGRTVFKHKNIHKQTWI